MRRFKLVGKLLRDVTGSVLVETTIVFPLFIVLVFGSVDAAYLLFDWQAASKATYIGARTAVVSDPVAIGLTTVTYDPTKTNSLCYDPSTGSSTGNCPTVLASACTVPTTNPPKPTKRRKLYKLQCRPCSFFRYFFSNVGNNASSPTAKCDDQLYTRRFRLCGPTGRLTDGHNDQLKVRDA
jgi:hypothetical protein